ncbi:uncharacterized protein L203_102372 [Cryptococcus depauperatus CBS 7841]|uniref:SYO1-like TPR repeats domain-containing protein n=1 Tax=Cryptococcus depauperatus CBS 7841 TaxID=1295531 RepID=A0AAJ8M098_9TREE
MGKAQTKKKSQGWRHNPVRVPDTHLGGGKGEGKADPQKEKQMLPILKKLSSPEYADRTWACAAISNLIQNDAATRRLFQGKNVVGELIERLSDNVDEVVVEASGALRNLAIDGGREICGEMVNKGIMSHLSVLIGKISITVDQITSGSGETPNFQARKHILSLSENIILILWSLAEAGPKALANVNALGCEELLIKILEGREKLSLGVTVAAAQTLFVLSQDNPAFRKRLIVHLTALPSLIQIVEEDHNPTEIRHKASDNFRKGESGQNEVTNIADGLPNGQALFRRVLVSGVLRNVIRAGSRADEKVGINALTASTILPLINGLLDVNTNDVCERVGQLVKQIPEEDVVKTFDKNVKTDHLSAPEVALQCIERGLNTSVAALEVLTNICAGLEDEEEVAEVAVEASGDGTELEEMEEDEDAAMDDEMDDERLISMGREPDSAIDVEASVGPNVNPGATLSYLLTNLRLPERLASLGRPVPLSFPPTSNVPSIHPPTTAVLSIIHLHALEALNNLLLTTVASIQSGGSSQAIAAIPVQDLWDTMFSIVQLIGSEPDALEMKGQEMRMEVFQMALGCIWGTTKVAPSKVIIQQQEVQILMQSVDLVSDEIIKSRVIETLAVIASKQGISNDENKTITLWFMQRLTASSSSPETLIALLDGIMDIYADEAREYDVVFEQSNYLQSLSSLVGKVRMEVRKIDKRKDRILRVRGDEVWENLIAFIRYRRSIRK